MDFPDPDHTLNRGTSSRQSRVRPLPSREGVPHRAAVTLP